MTSQSSPDGPGIITIQGQAGFGPNRSIISQSRDHLVAMDLRKERGGDDSSPTPPEYLALSLAGCVLNLTRVLAEEQGLPTQGIETRVEGTINPAKAFGLISDDRAGFLDFRVAIRGVEAWSPNQQAVLLEALETRCPLCDTLANPTPIRYRIDREPLNHP